MLPIYGIIHAQSQHIPQHLKWTVYEVIRDYFIRFFTARTAEANSVVFEGCSEIT